MGILLGDYVLQHEYTLGIKIDPRPQERVEGYCDMGEGWRPIVSKLLIALDQPDIKWDHHITQVKEKFGGLRFYVGSASDKAYKLIHDAEAESYKICMKCGQPGEPRNNGWITTLCQACQDKLYPNALPESPPL